MAFACTEAIKKPNDCRITLISGCYLARTPGNTIDMQPSFASTPRYPVDSHDGRVVDVQSMQDENRQHTPILGLILVKSLPTRKGFSMYEAHPFEHSGKKYEVRSASDGCTIRVRAFLDGKPANGYTYQVEIPTQVDAIISRSTVNPAKNLIEMAISDVKRGIWEQYIAALGASANSA